MTTVTARAIGGMLRIAAFLAAFAPQTALAVDTVPLADVNGLLQVQVSVDGAPPVPMLLDLGAGVDVLSTTLGRRYVAVKGKYVSLRLNGERVDLPIGTVVTLSAAGVRLDAPHVGIWGGLDGTGVDGLISATAFRDIAATFDFRSHQLIVEDAQTFSERKRTALRVPLMLQDDLGIALGVFARFAFGNGQTGLCEIDTGSQGIRIDRVLAPALGVNLADPRLRRARTPAGEEVTARIPGIALDGVPETMVAQPEVTFANLIYDCTVGNAFWAGRAFTLDLRNHVFYVSTGS